MVFSCRVVSVFMLQRSIIVNSTIVLKFRCISRKKKIFYTDETWCNVTQHAKKQPSTKDTSFSADGGEAAGGGGGRDGAATVLQSRVIMCHVSK